MGLLALLVWPAFAAGDGGGADALRSYFESVERLSGRFEQTTLDERGEVVETSEGRFALARPDRFNWFYATPFEQRIVADGRWLYVYDIELSQVTVRPMDEVLGVGPALLLSGDYATLRENFEVRASGEGWYTLTPTAEEWDFQAVRLRLGDGVPSVIEVDDGLGQTTRLELLDLTRNPRFADDRFTLEIPDGVDVIAPPAYRDGTS